MDDRPPDDKDAKITHPKSEQISVQKEEDPADEMTAQELNDTYPEVPDNLKGCTEMLKPHRFLEPSAYGGDYIDWSTRFVPPHNGSCCKNCFWPQAGLREENRCNPCNQPCACCGERHDSPDHPCPKAYATRRVWGRRRFDVVKTYIPAKTQLRPSEDQAKVLQANGFIERSWHYSLYTPIPWIEQRFGPRPRPNALRISFPGYEEYKRRNYKEAHAAELSQLQKMETTNNGSTQKPATPAARQRPQRQRQRQGQNHWGFTSGYQAIEYQERKQELEFQRRKQELELQERQAAARREEREYEERIVFRQQQEQLALQQQQLELAARARDFQTHTMRSRHREIDQLNTSFVHDVLRAHNVPLASPSRSPMGPPTHPYAHKPPPQGPKASSRNSSVDESRPAPKAPKGSWTDRAEGSHSAHVPRYPPRKSYTPPRKSYAKDPQSSSRVRSPSRNVGGSTPIRGQPLVEQTSRPTLPTTLKRKAATLSDGNDTGNDKPLNEDEDPKA